MGQGERLAGCGGGKSSRGWFSHQAAQSTQNPTTSRWLLLLFPLEIPKIPRLFNNNTLKDIIIRHVVWLAELQKKYYYFRWFWVIPVQSLEGTYRSLIIRIRVNIFLIVNVFWIVFVNISCCCAESRARKCCTFRCGCWCPGCCCSCCRSSTSSMTPTARPTLSVQVTVTISVQGYLAKESAYRQIQIKWVCKQCKTKKATFEKQFLLSPER